MRSVSTRKAVSKACDACRRRKIKCNGLRPCAGCLSADLACSFDAPRGQGGNRGARATVLNELRAKAQYRDISPLQDLQPSSSSLEADKSPGTVALPIPEQNTVDTAIDAYVKCIYPVVPLLDVAVIKAHASLADVSTISHQFILAFCAYAGNFGKVSAFFDGAYSQHLLESAVSVQDARSIAQPTPLSVYISFFLYGAWAGQGDYQQAWYHLREATTLFMMLKPKFDEWYDDKAQRCLFWILVVSERSHAIRRNRPITIPISNTSPSLDDTGEVGLLYLASLFRPFDEIFFASWNGATHECSKEWLLRLEYDVRTALPLVLDVSVEETANLRISQYWLQIKLWELFPRFGFLSSESAYECLTFRYPLAVAKDFTATAVTLPISSLQVHGVGMTEKVFDIACALADVLPFVSDPEVSPVDSLAQMASILMQLPGGTSKFMPLLLAKVHELLPELAKQLCEAAEMPLITFNDPMSPDTRFVYEEEVGWGLYTDLRR